MTDELRYPRICVVLGHLPSPSETFLQAHIDRLPGRNSVAYGWLPILDGQPIRSPSILARIARKIVRQSRNQCWQEELTDAYVKAFERCRADAVLVEYGDNAVMFREACQRVGIPLIAHFHGYDASLNKCLQEMEDEYPLLFRDAAAIVAVSQAMRTQLIRLGAPPKKVHWNPYGVDCTQFQGSNPAAAPMTFLAVGRFTEKKAPHLTLRAFAEVHRKCPEAQLRMIGFGPLLEGCEDVARELKINGAVSFLGKCTPEVVQQEMRGARCFVQHSVVAPNGDSEGTPVSILEAGASGLPVVSTRHAGIPDVVVDGETGMLVDEHDVAGMAACMLQFARDPELAGQFGRAARSHIASGFSQEKSISRLWTIINDCVQSPAYALV